MLINNFNALQKYPTKTNPSKIKTKDRTKIPPKKQKKDSPFFNDR